MQIGLTTAAAGLPDAQLIPTLARKQDDVDVDDLGDGAVCSCWGTPLDIRTTIHTAPPDQKTLRTFRRPSSAARSTG